MTYAKIESGVVTNMSTTPEDGYVEVPDNISPGMIQNKDKSFSNPPKTNEEILDNLRVKRDQLLRETDVYALSDRNLSDEMKKYRHDLRNLPASNSDPLKIVFPKKPE